ncbi:MAG: DNA topoisomerase IB [Mangrovibacterium sp.]
MIKNKVLPPSLVYVSDAETGYKRARGGDGFVYLDQKGQLITDKKILDRIRNLGIPPMWENVWICRKAKGHIQATGRDTRGRKQYVYHNEWNEFINEQKYDNLYNFALALPRIREQMKKALRNRKWNKEKVTALAISLMDVAYLRVGNQQYRKLNGTYGLTTLRRKHLQENRDGLVLRYMAKSGKLRRITIRDPRLKRLLRECSELPGYELFRYQSEGGFHSITSQDVNQYLLEISGGYFTAKTFRTWGGTVLSVKLEPKARALLVQYPRRKPDTTLIRLVAEELNNTISVCRKYYIHPLVLEFMINGNWADLPPVPEENSEWYNPDERICLRILKHTNQSVNDHDTSL